MSISQTQETSKSLQWDSSPRYLKGVGPEKHKLLERLGIQHVSDLFYFFPRRYEKRFPIKTVQELHYEEKECVRGTVISRSVQRRGGLTVFRAVLSDGTGRVEALYYRQPFLMDVFQPESQVLLFGKAEKVGLRARMIHPEYEIVKEGGETQPIHAARWTPVYPLTEDLSQKTLRGLIFRVVNEHRSLVKDPWSARDRRRLSLIPLEDAFQNIHFPKDVVALKAAYRRLVFDEFFSLEKVIEAKKASMRTSRQALVHSSGETALRAWVSALDMELTGAQKRALEDILKDMKSGQRMHRLVQGDVGSGKTVVAAGTFYFTLTNGFQGALMAPTEVLAQQLYFQMKRFLEPYGIRCAYLAQSVAASVRSTILKETAAGTIQLLVGTHALLNPEVRFAKLGLAVVDEQHKFGAFQRTSLREKGDPTPHFLLMTATPIPRTLCMTLYGDLDVSAIDEKPVGRMPVRTFWVEQKKRALMHRWLEGLLSEGAQAYVICPQIENGTAKEMKSATEELQRLKGIFPGRRLGLLHGRLSSAEKKKVMALFKQKTIDLLVSTVVVEVGVDVPDARAMIIENAERFGLAQLHQLRGRIGRGQKESVCILFSDAVNPEAVERLNAFESTDSGFEIAEMDLKQRGVGQFLGARQHGLPEIRIGDLTKDLQIFMLARQEAQRVVKENTR